MILQRNPSVVRALVLCRCSGFVLYALTAQQGVSWQDSGMLQFRIVTGDYTGNLGLALAHPLYIAIGRLFLLLPFGSRPGAA